MMPAVFALALMVVAAKRAPGTLPRKATATIAVGFATALVLSLFLVPWNRLDLTAGTNVYFRRAFVVEESRLLYWFEDAAGGITTVVEAPSPRGEVRTLLTNGKFQGNDGGEISDQISFGLVPSALRPARERAMWIGLGTGQSANVVHAAGFKAIDVVELSAGMPNAAEKWFGEINGNILGVPGVNLHMEDGRNFLLRTRERYDLIGMEVTSIWFAGATNLYSREFYRLARSRLKPRGVLQQWVQLHHASVEEVLSVVATVRAEFPYVTLWKLGSQGCIVAGDEPLALDPSAMADLAASRPMAPLLWVLEHQTGLTLANLHDALLLDADDVTRLAAEVARSGIPLNTDSNRYLEYESPRHNLDPLPHQRLVVERLLGATSDTERSEKTARFLAQ